MFTILQIIIQSLLLLPSTKCRRTQTKDFTQNINVCIYDAVTVVEASQLLLISNFGNICRTFSLPRNYDELSALQWDS